jgi:hypothetical protein
VANEYHRRFSGYFDAALLSERQTYVRVSGRGAVSVAERLSAKQPMLLIIPVPSEQSVQIRLVRPEGNLDNISEAALLDLLQTAPGMP